MHIPMHVPTQIKYEQHRRVLTVVFSETEQFELPAEYLRVFSPSAEVQGHGLAESLLVTDKESVAISKIEPVGRYAIKLHFDDGHNTGIYSWTVLHELVINYQKNWQRYLSRLEAGAHTHSQLTHPQPVGTDA